MNKAKAGLVGLVMALAAMSGPAEARRPHHRTPIFYRVMSPPYQNPYFYQRLYNPPAQSQPSLITSSQYQRPPQMRTYHQSVNSVVDLRRDWWPMMIQHIDAQGNTTLWRRIGLHKGDEFLGPLLEGTGYDGQGWPKALEYTYTYENISR